MSEQQLNEKIGSLVLEYGNAKKRLREITDQVKHIAERLSAIANGMNASNPMAVNGPLSELPEDLTPAKIRGLMAEQNALSSRVRSLKSQLSDYGVDLS